MNFFSLQKKKIKYLPDDCDEIDGPRSAWPDKLLDRPEPNESDEKLGPGNPIGAAAGAAIGADSEIGCEKPPPC